MDLQRIVSELKKERDHIDRAIVALEGRDTAAKPRKTTSTLRVTRKSRKHRLTAEGRKRLSEAMKKRWAARRRGNGKMMSKAA
jgi:Spy/CpxP family protein refolding chaperone